MEIRQFKRSGFEYFKSQNRPNIGIPVILILIFATMLAACGGSTSSTSASPSKSKNTSSSNKASESAFATCMAQHGVTIPTHLPGSFKPQGEFQPGSGTGNGNGTGNGTGTPRFSQNSKFAEAFAACKGKERPGKFQFGAGRTFKLTPAQQQALTTYEQCMTSHGVAIASNASIETIRSLLKSDPTAATANAACSSDLNGVFHGVFGKANAPSASSTSTTLPTTKTS